MADTVYTDTVTLLTADTMNDLNRLHYTILIDPAGQINVCNALDIKGAAVASAASPDIWAAGPTMHITGTTTITSFPTAPSAGVWRKLIFDGAVLLTNGANFVVQGNMNYTTAANDMVYVYADTTTKFYLFLDRAGGVGYLNIPINSQSAAYTTVLADSGKCLYHPSTDANARTFTIDSNANVAYVTGTVLTFLNKTSQVLSIAITTDTMTLAGGTSTGTRSLAQNGIATAIKDSTTGWLISGTGLT